MQRVLPPPGLSTEENESAVSRFGVGVPKTVFTVHSPLSLVLSEQSTDPALCPIAVWISSAARAISFIGKPRGALPPIESFVHEPCRTDHSEARCLKRTG